MGMRYQKPARVNEVSQEVQKLHAATA
jgi:hypothetical protein